MFTVGYTAVSVIYVKHGIKLTVCLIAHQWGTTKGENLL